MNDHRLKRWLQVTAKSRIRSATRANSVYNVKVIIRNLRLLILNVLLPYLVSDVATRRDPIAPPPQMWPQYRSEAIDIPIEACANSSL